jgi:hypothetical protein
MTIKISNGVAHVVEEDMRVKRMVTLIWEFLLN